MCSVEIANCCWDHMISCMKQSISRDDELTMMLSAGNHDNAVNKLSENLKEDKVLPWLLLYVNRYA